MQPMTRIRRPWQRFSVQLPHTLADELRRVAVRIDRSYSYVICDAVERYLAMQTEADNNRATLESYCTADHCGPECRRVG